MKDLGKHSTEGDNGDGYLCPHRKYGFTVFAETDDVWEQELAKMGNAKRREEITVEDVKNYLMAIGAYPEAKTDDDYKSKENIVNQFVTYHVLPEGISRDKLVLHWNEVGHSPTGADVYSIPVMEFYETMGKRRLLKIFQSKESNAQSTLSDGIYLNRFPVLQNGRGAYRYINDNRESGEFYPISGEAMCEDENEGIEILHHPVYAMTNGYFYPLGKMLVCTENVCRQLQHQRIRFDATSMFPEFMNNGLRGNKVNLTEFGRNRGFPYNYNYLEGVDIHEGTKFFYLPGRTAHWQSYQGDELNIIGRYEFTMRLPPVPRAGHYEIRYGWNANGIRSMCQVYWGTDKDNLPAMGIPLDLRMGGTTHYTTNMPSIVGWEEDLEDDPETNNEIDKRMRNNGYMKAPNCYTNNWGSYNSCRSQPDVLRCIIVSEYMYPDKTYYLKFKSVLDSEERQANMDYLEFCAKEVYDNPEEAEDIW